MPSSFEPRPVLLEIGQGEWMLQLLMVLRRGAEIRSLTPERNLQHLRELLDIAIDDVGAKLKEARRDDRHAQPRP